MVSTGTQASPAFLLISKGTWKSLCGLPFTSCLHLYAVLIRLWWGISLQPTLMFIGQDSWGLYCENFSMIRMKVRNMKVLLLINMKDISQCFWNSEIYFKSLSNLENDSIFIHFFDYYFPLYHSPYILIDYVIMYQNEKYFMLHMSLLYKHCELTKKRTFILR
jgi:hypothetical protein